LSFTTLTDPNTSVSRRARFSAKYARIEYTFSSDLPINREEISEKRVTAVLPKAAQDATQKRTPNNPATSIGWKKNPTAPVHSVVTAAASWVRRIPTSPIADPLVFSNGDARPARRRAPNPYGIRVKYESFEGQEGKNGYDTSRERKVESKEQSSELRDQRAEGTAEGGAGPDPGTVCGVVGLLLRQGREESRNDEPNDISKASAEEGGGGGRWCVKSTWA
jgi:hypothetical protein